MFYVDQRSVIGFIFEFVMQERAEKILRDDKAHPVRGKPEQAGEAALVALEPNSGAVRVMVGGRDYGTSPYNRAVLASRSPGSAFKPVVFLAALNEGIVSASSLLEVGICRRKRKALPSRVLARFAPLKIYRRSS